MKKIKGISLIVLVITIIIMIIIAGAIILSLSNTNVIDQAEQAKDKYNLSQVKEAVNLDRTNALLTRYNTTEGVNISVKELLGLTDSDAMNVASTNTIPANMPEGKYYKLDVTKYGMQSAGTVENNTIKGAYVINDNYDIYYVVEGTASEVAKEIDDEKVIEIIMANIAGTKDEETTVTELKQELDIKNVEGNNIVDIAFGFVNETGEKYFYYFYTKHRLYLIKLKEVEGQFMQELEYAPQNEYVSEYAYAERIEEIRKELTIALNGKTEVEIQAKHTDGTLEQYVLDKCRSIKRVKFYDDWRSDEFIQDMTFMYENKEVNLCEFNTPLFILDEYGMYKTVTIVQGN